VFIQLEGQFVDPVQHLLLCRGLCCAACFRHGGFDLTLGRDRFKS
jgi:hypothetical protein